MSATDPIRVFVTHEFAEHEEFSRVFEYLECRDRFYYENRSKLDAQSPTAPKEVLEEELRKQIKGAEVVIAPVGMFGHRSPLLLFQLTLAQAFKRPILAIQAFGGTVAMVKEVNDAADDIIDWNDRVITDKIRELARGEDTNTWDMIEFDMDEEFSLD